MFKFWVLLNSLKETQIFFREDRDGIVGKMDKRPFHRTSEHRLPSGSDNTPLG